MPGPRNLPARSSQRRNTQQEEPLMRTRSGRGSKSAAKADKPDIASPKATSKDSGNAPLTRKATRSASNISSYANLDSAADVYASYEKPLFMVFGLTPEFFDSLPEEPALAKSKNSRQKTKAELLALNTLFAHSEEEDSSSSEESDVPVPSQPAPRGRGRGGRGSRGGRGRGGRGRGRGGRGRGAAARTTSPLRTRPSRNAAPMFPLTEADDEETSNQNSPIGDAKESPEPEEEVTSTDEEPDVAKNEEDEEEKSDEDLMEDVQATSFTPTTPPGSPPAELVQAYDDPSMKIPVPVAIPKISLPEDSTGNTPLEGSSTPAAPVVPKLLSPDDDVLSDYDLPDPWTEGQPPPIEAECEDRADYLLKTRFKPMTDVGAIIASLTKFPLSQRSTENLYALAENTQMILKAWQDEYLKLDARTAPHAHPPKKPCNGGRIPMNPLTFEDMKEADLYGYTYDPKKPPGMQDPFTQRLGHEKTNGRELRQRRARDMLDSAAPSEEDDEEEEGRPAKRQRRATRRFEGSDQGTGTGTGTNTPKKNNGWGGARKKGVSKYAQPAASQTPEPEGRGKRGKSAASALLHQRIQEMREESAVTSSGDEGSSNANSYDADDYLVPSQKRGRPSGSRNTGRRSDYGMKKGPRKRPHEEEAPVPSAHAPNAPPPALQSMSDGQIQFSVDPPMGANLTPPVIGPHSTETVFQATPQPPGAPEAGGLARSVKDHTPETYMNTTPLSQYGNSYMDESAANSASGSRKKPRVKSEKRSQSMTIWWAERKARQKELEEKSGTPVKTPISRSNSSSGRRGGRLSAGTSASKPPPEPQSRPTTSHAEPPTQPAPQESYPVQYQPPPPPFSASSPNSTYAPMAYPPPPPVMIAPTPLAALSSGPPPPPNLGPVTPSAPPVPTSARALAPAPLPPQIPQSYPSPYGPRTAPKVKTGPPPLAPAPPPSHVSPYPPMVQGLGVQPREMPFKVMIPGPPPDEQRRGSR
ncbi:hypothetical protein K458DRAFT_446185 [Lentithecium fluviatile CBS 122367]|uniref:Uncharacterized protein n=1 Tax=Lentithecium fluviatile CBS 122367 TaxID=1168545 RepID=A0A6G1IKY2_9PLEO|nr:hypothetical protein K458DRAFT_446185 [Lentithecium fluviatile CBS 122367]